MTGWPDTFIFDGFDIDEAAREVALKYRLGDQFAFREVIGFDAPLPAVGSPLRAGFEAALEALHILAGVSYYKVCVPRHLVIRDTFLDDGQKTFFQSLYVDGLGEFGVRNNIDVASKVDFLNARFDRAAAGPRLASDVALPRRAAVLVGGGKDSLVSVEMLRAGGEPITLFAVNPKKPILECAAASDLPFVKVTRKLDPLLFDLNAKGALNGHVPITAIVSLIALAASFVHGFDAVVLSNERSADQGNVTVAGHEVNHQFSKTSGAEQELANYVSRHIARNLTYFSLLRPLSEAHIGQLMARSTRYDHAFTSCNRSFQINPKEEPKRWCGDCPKCRFTFLILANAMEKKRIESILGKNMLDDPSQITGYEELMGLSGHKPWECVGEIAESGAALLRLAERDEWKDTAIVRALAPRLAPLMPDWRSVWQELMMPSQEHFLSPHYAKLLDAYVR